MLKLIVPLAIVGFLLHVPTVVTSVFCARLNSTQSVRLYSCSVRSFILVMYIWREIIDIPLLQQSAASLAMSTSNYVGFSFILGILTAYESLGSQALGAGKRSRLGLLTVRSIIISLVISCYVAIIWFFSENIFNLVTSTKPMVDEEAGMNHNVIKMICHCNINTGTTLLSKPIITSLCYGRLASIQEA